MSSASSFASQRQQSHTDHADTETDSEWDRYTQDSEDEDDSLRANAVCLGLSPTHMHQLYRDAACLCTSNSQALACFHAEGTQPTHAGRN